MTNYEKIKAMDIDELAELLDSYGTCGFCIYRERREECDVQSCENGVKKWLESEAEDNGTV